MPLKWVNVSPVCLARSVNHSEGAGATGGAALHAARKKKPTKNEKRETRNGAITASRSPFCFRAFCVLRFPLVITLPEVAVQHLFGELHALELEELEVLLRVLVEHEADLPRTREKFRIGNRR